MPFEFDRDEESPLQFRVHQVCQTSSGGSHVTIYEANLDLVGGDVRVEILSVYPADADQDSVDLAREAIRRGAENVMRPAGLGGIIRVKRLVVHPVDFKPRRFEQHTAEELRRLLEEQNWLGPGAHCP